MSSNSFHDLIGLDVVHYSFELACRIATVSDKTYATKLSHFIKLFLYSIQNRDSIFFSSCEFLRALYEWVYFLKEFDKNKFKKSKKFNERFSSMKRQDIEILKTAEWSTDLALLNSYFFEDCNISTKTRFFLKILFWSERMLDFWKLIDVRKIYVKIENFSWKFCECVILLSEVFK